MSDVTEEDVRAAYRFLLNREPESDVVVKSKVSAHPTIQSLRQAFLTSPEFLNETLRNIAIDNSRKEPNSVVVDVDPARLLQLVEHVRRQWTALGASNPHWSVLTHDEYRAENLNKERLQRFYASGEADANLIDVFERRAGRRVSRGRCFELGCGVGRVTKYLAQKFESVVAADISPGNLALCEKHMEEAGASNVKPVLLASPYDIDQLGDFDFFYSVISIQHNPPPVQKLLLDKILPKIRVGGGCLFQTPDAPNYTYTQENVENPGTHIMDTHSLPRAVVLRIMQDHGLKIGDVATAGCTGILFGSFTYFGVR
jgi:SAM-dependent methyltransferase